MTRGPGLYDPLYEHDACGLGFVARIDGRRTRETVEEGLEVLHNLEHRGTTGSDPETGDGAGILTQIPDAFLRKECKKLGLVLPESGGYGVGMLFETGEAEGPDCGDRLAEICAEEGHELLGFRDVPVVPEAVGRCSAQRHAAHQAVLRRASWGRRGGLRAEAIRHQAPPARGPRGLARLLRRQPLREDGHLQGTLEGPAVVAVLPRPWGRGFRQRHSARPRAVLDQHPWELGARAPLPLHSAQRRGQHHKGQHKLDEGPREPPAFGRSSGMTSGSSRRSSREARATPPPSTTPSSSCTSRGGASRTRSR